MALSCFNCSLLSQISFSEFKFISPILNPVHSVHGYTCPVDDMLQLSIPAEHTGCSRYNAGFLHKSFDFVEHRESCSFVYWFLFSKRERNNICFWFWFNVDFVLKSVLPSICGSNIPLILSRISFSLAYLIKDSVSPKYILYMIMTMIMKHTEEI